jgi:hypothetical protein
MTKRIAMRKNFPAGLFLISIAAVGCHARWNPIGSPPGYSVSHESGDGKFGVKLDATVSDEDNHYMQAFRFEIPAPGAISATAKPINPQAQISVAIYAEGSGTDPIAKGEPGKKVEATELQPGTYYVAVQEPWKEAIRSKVELRVIYKPQDPDALQTTCKSQATARDLSAGGMVEDQVDYSAQRRTCFWKVTLGGDGALQVKFNNQGNNISADFVPAQGAPEKIDPVAGLNKTDLPAGDYYVKVYANDAGDAGKYSLQTTFKQGDTCKNGGPACDISGAEDLKLPSDSKNGDVDYSKSKQFHFYKASLKEKGKFTISFKILQPPRGSKVAAYFMRNPDDEGDKIVGTSATKDIDQPGDYYIRVQAPDTGDAAKYAVATIWAPANFIAGDVIEIGRSPCVLTVGAGTEQGVRQGVACTVVSASGQPLDSCVVEEVFPRLSKVKPGNPRCNIQSTAKVQISAQ